MFRVQRADGRESQPAVEKWHDGGSVGKGDVLLCDSPQRLRASKLGRQGREFEVHAEARRCGGVERGGGFRPQVVRYNSKIAAAR